MLFQAKLFQNFQAFLLLHLMTPEHTATTAKIQRFHLSNFSSRFVLLFMETHYSNLNRIKALPLLGALCCVLLCSQKLLLGKYVNRKIKMDLTERREARVRERERAEEKALRALKQP